MSQHSLHNVLLITVLCTAVVFISGIALPKFFSEQVVELQSELNENDFQSNFTEISMSNTEILDAAVSGIVNSHLSENKQNLTLPLENRLTKRRSKRGVLPQKSKKYSWHFNLNVMRNGKTDSTPSINSQKDSSINDKTYLGMSIYMEGNGSRKEMERSLNSVEAFVQNVFGNEDERLEFSDLEIPSDSKLISNAVVKEESNKKPRGARFFNFFGLRNRASTTTSESLSSETVTTPTISTSGTHETDKNNFRLVSEPSVTESGKGKKMVDAATLFDSSGVTETLDDAGVQQELVTELIKKGLNFSSDSLTKQNDSETVFAGEKGTPQFSETVDSALDKSIRDGCDCYDYDPVPIESSVNYVDLKPTTVGGKANSEISLPEHKCDCSDYDYIPAEPNESYTDQASTVFSHETLEDFCMDLVNQLEDAQRLLRDASNSEHLINSTHDLNASNEDPAFLLSLEESEPTPEKDSIEESYFLNSNSSIQINESSNIKNREGKFLGFNFFGLGSGRSAFDDSADSSFEEEVSMEIVPSVQDCENYFRKKQIKMFSKPNLMDMISDPSIKLTDFANATISPKLREQQLQFLSDLLLRLGQSAKSDPPSRENVLLQTPFSSEISNFEEVQSLRREQNVGHNIPKDTASVTVGSLGSKPPGTTEVLRDGRLIGIFGGFGSGRFEAETPVDEDGRFFLGNFFSSGDGRFFNESESFENAFQEFSEYHVDFNETQNDEGRFFNFMNFGSGDGRQFTEDSTLTDAFELIEDEHENNCSMHAGGLSYDCDFDEDIENPLNHAIVTDSNEYEHHYPDSDIDKFNIFEDSSVSQEWDDVDETQTPTQNEEMPEASMQKAKFFSIFVDNGSGDGRIFTNDPDHNDTQAETSLVYSHENDYETDYLNPCNDCENLDLQSHTVSDTNETQCSDCSEGYHVNDESYEEIILKPDFKDYPVGNGAATEIAHDYKFKKSDETEELTEKSVRIIGTVFLTGSGDGSLIEDDGGSINLVEEDTIKPPDLPSRGVRRLDIPEEDTLPGGSSRGSRKLDFPEDIFEPTDLIFPVTINTEPQLQFSEITNFVSSVTFPELTTTTTVDFSRRSGRLDIQEDIDSENTFAVARGSSTNIETLNNVPFEGNISSPTVVTHSNTASSSIADVSSTPKAQSPQPVFCNSARECNYRLNERCVKKGPSLVCDCLEPLVREKNTRKCAAKVSMDVSVRFPEEEFNEELRNPESERFKQTRNHALITMNFLFQHASQLIPVIASFNVTGFNPGSLVVNTNLVLASETKSESELEKAVEDGLKTALGKESLIQNLPLNARDASLLSVLTLDPCSSPESNYCSKNARCIRNTTLPGGFICSCKDDYFDASSDLLPGEACKVLCRENFCGANGQCVSTGEERHCLCKGWYFGDQCEISGVVVVVVFAANLAAFVMVILLIVFRGRCRRSQSYRGELQTFRRSEEVGIGGAGQIRVPEVIAMAESTGIGVAKFHYISNLVTDNPPIIKVTHPTSNESIISFECDSTFASEPSTGTTENQASRIYDEVPGTA